MIDNVSAGQSRWQLVAMLVEHIFAGQSWWLFPPRGGARDTNSAHARTSRDVISYAYVFICTGQALYTDQLNLRGSNTTCTHESFACRPLCPIQPGFDRFLCVDHTPPTSESATNFKTALYYRRGKANHAR